MSMTESEATKRIKECRNTPSFQPWFYMNEALNMAITALEEIQQYRAIGTVEELRELKEKATAKHRCPNCNEVLNPEYRFCPTCRRKVDWSEGKE